VPQAGAWGLQYVMLNLFRIMGAFLFVLEIISSTTLGSFPELRWRLGFTR